MGPQKVTRGQAIRVWYEGALREEPGSEPRILRREPYSWEAYDKMERPDALVVRDHPLEIVSTERY